MNPLINPRIRFDWTPTERRKRVHEMYGSAGWQRAIGQRGVRQGASIGIACIRCHTRYSMQSTYIDEFGRCRQCLGELYELPDGDDEKERWNRKYLRRIR